MVDGYGFPDIGLQGFAPNDGYEWQAARFPVTCHTSPVTYCVTSRKKLLLFVGESVTSSRKLARLSVGVFVNVIQFAVLKSKFCCNTKLVAGTIQEKTRLPFADVRFNSGFGVVCDM